MACEDRKREMPVFPARALPGAPGPEGTQKRFAPVPLALRPPAGTRMLLSLIHTSRAGAEGVA